MVYAIISVYGTKEPVPVSPALYRLSEQVSDLLEMPIEDFFKDIFFSAALYEEASLKDTELVEAILERYLESIADRILAET